MKYILPVTLDAFKEAILREKPEELSSRLLKAKEISVFGHPDNYEIFKDQIRDKIEATESVFVAGSGNWGFSLNPYKLFNPFHAKSDIDVAIISRTKFHFFWEEMRKSHRDRYYQLDYYEKNRLKRNGQNVYSGFVSPDRIPERYSPIQFDLKRLLNQLSNGLVGYREVKALFFKSEIEAVDYYARSIVLARKELSK